MPRFAGGYPVVHGVQFSLCDGRIEISTAHDVHQIITHRQESPDLRRHEFVQTAEIAQRADIAEVHAFVRAFDGADDLVADRRIVIDSQDPLGIFARHVGDELPEEVHRDVEREQGIIPGSVHADGDDSLMVASEIRESAAE